MSVKNGTRPGTTKKDKYPGWDYMRSSGPKWEEIRADDRETMRWEGGLNQAIEACERSLAALHVAHVMLHGGHVERGTMARSGLKKDADPVKVATHIQGLLPKELNII